MTYTFTDPSPVVVGQATKKSFWDKVFDNTFRLKADSLRTGDYTVAGNIGGGEDTIMSMTIPAATLVEDGKALRITSFGDLGGSSNNTIKFKIYTTLVGTQQVISTGAVAIYSYWRLDAIIQRRGAALTRCFGTISSNLGGSPSTPFMAFGAADTTHAFADAITLSITGESAGGTTDNIRHLATLVEVLG